MAIKMEEDFALGILDQTIVEISEPSGRTPSGMLAANYVKHCFIHLLSGLEHCNLGAQI